MARNSRIAGKEQTRRRSQQLVAFDALYKRIVIVMDGAAIPVNGGKERLPTHTIIESQLLSYLPGVAEICPGVFVPLERGRRRAHCPLSYIPHQIIRQSQIGCLAGESRSPIRIEIGVRVDPPPRELCTNSELVVPANHAEIIIAAE